MNTWMAPIAALTLIWATQASAQSLAAANTPASVEARCAALLEQRGDALGETTARILSARINARSDARVDPKAPPWMPAIPAMPAHCEVVGVLRERTGSDGNPFAVRFHLRLPLEWNDRFLFQGGGGTNGELGSATGALQPGMPTGLERGFAVVSTDTGHDNAVNNDPARQGTVAFGHDYQARLEYSEKALDSVASVAKRVVLAYYGKPAARSFFVGCSNGGREGMVFAQRFPEQFDGIVAGAPAFAVPKAALAEAWDTQTFAKLATTEGVTQANGLPDLARTLSDADLKLIAAAVAQVCDADDGVTDGMIQNLARCTTARVRPQLMARACEGAKAEGCLGQTQIDAMERSLAGPRNGRGQALYAAWPWDIGIGESGWRIWKIGIPGAMPAINVMLGAPALSGLFVTPPADVAGSNDAGLRYQLAFDFDRDAPKIFATSSEHPRSGWDLVGAQSTDLSRFHARGGRMIVTHGGSDPIFSINDTIAWWEKLNAASGRKAADFVRVFAVPGMNHCAGGPATDQFDALTSVMNWVEKGQAPDTIAARAGAQSPWPGRTRPLCVYPAIARYQSGDINRAESFICKKG